MLVQIMSFARIESAGCSTLGDEEKAGFFCPEILIMRVKNYHLQMKQKKISHGISVAVDVLNKYEALDNQEKKASYYFFHLNIKLCTNLH